MEVAVATILFVDDDPTILRDLTMALAPRGHQVLTAGDGLAALALLDEQPVDLILTDVAMPRLGSFELYKQVKYSARPELVLIPVVVLSARGPSGPYRG